MLWKIVLSGLLLILSFPNFNLNYLAFIGFIPLFFAVENGAHPGLSQGFLGRNTEPAIGFCGGRMCKSPKKAFLIFFIAGFIFYLGTLYWLYHVTVIGLIILCLYLAVYFGIFGIAINRFGILAAPIAWVILEYLQANISVMGFGWTLLGYSQYKNLPLIQIADFSGAYGVSFVVMMVNVGIYRSLRAKRSNLKLLAVTILVLIATYTYGFFRLNQNHSHGLIKVSVIQGNIPQELKWDPEAQDMIIQKYTALTKMASLDSPDLIVWPETSFPGFFEIDRDMTDKILNLSKEIKIPILLGVNTEKDSKYFNSAAFVSSKGKTIGIYNKIHLVPFGEYVPFSNRFPALHNLILGQLGEFTPGKEFRAFSFQPSAFSTPIKFSVLICFEDIFPKLSRQFVKNGAKFLVVITNDAWYGKSGAAYQHAACSVFRAIENRVPVVRCANTGYSCFIDSRGRIYDSVSEKNSHLFVTGYKTSIVKVK